MSLITVALVGNPNAGKSTLFNALSGLRQQVGNYPGVTVEMMKGHYNFANHRFELIDLPGTYSLAPRSPDEMVAVDLLLGRRPEERKPDVVLSIVDASNLDRHLYLTTQLLELGIPVVLAVNMIDVAQNQGMTIDCQRLAKESGLRVLPLQAHRGVGIDALKQALLDATTDKPPSQGPKLPDDLEGEVETLRRQVDVPTFLARRLLLDIGGSTEEWLIGKHGEPLKQQLDSARERLTSAGTSLPGLEAKTRYGWIRNLTRDAVTKPTIRPKTWSDAIDRTLTHRLWGTLFFLFVMFCVFQAIFVVAEPLMDLVGDGEAWLRGSVESMMNPGPLRSLLADGIIGGVGGILVFLPQIMILFAFIAILEDCGYMARAAFLMDRLMSRCGLSGKSFIPLLSSVACAVPGIMATRVIENRRDRLATIIVAPLMSCSARLPVYAILIGAFLTEGFAWYVPGLTLFAMYMLGFIVAPIVALILKRTLLKGKPPLFVMELPAYRTPRILTVLRRMGSAGTAFIRRAGTIILASMIVVWALLYFPNGDGNGLYENQIRQLHDNDHDAAANRLEGEWKRNSYLGQAGHFLEPMFTPLGWDWRIGMAAMASFPAREVIVGTLGIIYNVGEVDDEEGEDALRDEIRKEWSSDSTHGQYTIATAFSLMVFFALCCQCASTLAVIRRETHSWGWVVFTFLYMTVLAYFAALLTYQLGRFLSVL